MKAGTLAITICLGLLLLTPPALAASLLTGSVRDTHGAPITPAKVSGLDASGAVAGTATTGTDGTFALSTAVAPVSVRIECAYCRSKTIVVSAGEPVVAIIQRYDALIADGPTNADLAALPYVQIENALALRPFEVRRIGTSPEYPPSISDRGLAIGPLVLDGSAPTYNLAFNNTTALYTMPAHAGDAFTFQPASQAYQYGAYATGGTIAVSRDPSMIEQGAYGSQNSVRLSEAGSNAGVSFGIDAGDVTERERAIATASGNFFGGEVDGQLSTARATSSIEDGTISNSQTAASIGFSRTLGNFALRFDVADVFGTQQYLSVPDFWNDAAIRTTLTTTAGAVQLSAGASYANSTISFPQNGAAYSYEQNTIYMSAHIPGPTMIDAGVADTVFNSRTAHPSAILPSLVVTQSLGRLSVSAGFSQSALPTRVSPYGYLGVASLAEVHVAYGDMRRLRAEIQTYRQNTNVPDAQPLAGSGASVEYQLTPTTSIRAWSLRLFNDQRSYFLIGSEPYISGDTFWLTNQKNGFRLDAIYRRTAAISFAPSLPYVARRTFEGDIYFPVAARAQIGFRSELRPLRGRETSLVLSLQP